MKLIEHLKSILADEGIRMQIIKDELIEVKEKYGDERRSEIVLSGDDINIEDLIKEEDMVVTISHLGYIKRTSLEDFRTQGRGGKGAKGGNTRSEDFIEHVFVASTHNYILFFTEQGKCFWIKVYRLPEGSRTSKGRAIQNVINLPSDDKVKAYINVPNLSEPDFINNNYIVFCTRKGVIKKTVLEAFSRPRVNGINAITIREGDTLLEAKLTNGNSEIVLAKKSGYAIRFNESAVRSMGRTAAGVKGVTLKDANDEVVGMICVNPEEEGRTILVVSEKGFGKRTYLNDPEDGQAVYRITNRGGKGVKTLNVTDKTGSLITIKDVTDDDDLMIINKSGITIRISLDEVRVMGRATQGVRLIRLNDEDEIADVAKVEMMEGSDEEETEGESPEETATEE